ncbi:NifU family protein [Sporanaerobium hydrogeniformans]|uniref:NifU family protein n=1 Tax=Sporanaerobium hydrogeniformans TaxID=3072179 RepID=UPI0015D472C6|nr:NifU family protein [Sporanaerobium hydrogeniformans]
MELTAQELNKFIKEKINPRVQGDGGEVSFVSLEGQVLTVKVQGECSRCPLTSGCFKDWMVQEIDKVWKKQLTVKIIVKKPYFWDK